MTRIQLFLKIQVKENFEENYKYKAEKGGKYSHKTKDNKKIVIKHYFFVFRVIIF